MEVRERRLYYFKAFFVETYALIIREIASQLVLGDSGFGRFEDSIPRKIRSDRIPFVGFESLKDSLAIVIRSGSGFVCDSIEILIGIAIRLRIGLRFLGDSKVWDSDCDCDVM